MSVSSERYLTEGPLTELHVIRKLKFIQMQKQKLALKIILWGWLVINNLAKPNFKCYFVRRDNDEMQKRYKPLNKT